jgi:hypothetical protein
MIRSLLVKAATLGKTAVGDPVLPALFAAAVAEEDEPLGRCLAVTYWAGGEAALERVALEHADHVVAYGSREALESLRRRIRPEVPFSGYGHRISFAVVAREALEPGDAERHAMDAALAVATFDQQGCVSPHLIYVERGGRVAPREWARLVASAMASLEATLPRGSLSIAETSAIRQLRGEIEFARIAGGDHELLTSDPGTGWTVVYDPEPGFTPSCLNRVIRIGPVDSLEDVPRLVAPAADYLRSPDPASAWRRRLSPSPASARAGSAPSPPCPGLPPTGITTADPLSQTWSAGATGRRARAEPGSRSRPQRRPAVRRKRRIRVSTARTRRGSSRSG